MRMASDGTLLEDWMDAVAAASFAAASAFALAKVAPQLGVGVVACSVLALFGCWGILQRMSRELRLPLARFELVHFEWEMVEEHEELLLTDELIAPRASDCGESEELLLDDVLNAIAPDSRVVRLFAPDHMPTAGQLKASIDLHLQSRRAPAAAPDASQALSDALAELRRSLR